jgi:hypothetical protein
VVRTAVAPVFLLSGVGVTLTLLTNRLARVVDRARSLEQKESNTHERDMHVLAARCARWNGARACWAGRSHCVRFARCWCRWWWWPCFVGAFVHFRLSLVIATLFIVAMLSFIGGLLMFLREVFVATRRCASA